MNEVPGLIGSEIDASVLTTWAMEVRRLAHEQDRGIIAEQRIGHVLAHAPADADGSWPHRVVRELVEELNSDQVEMGIAIERFNMRGGFTKAMYEGGGQERSLAAQAQEWAKFATKWPRTHAMLIGISQSWDEQAKRENERARQDELRFEQ
jgi:alpha/beta superfamily hydrolase